MTFLLTVGALAVPETAVLVGAGVLLARRGQVGDPRRALLGRRELGDLTGPAALSRARQLRPPSPTSPPAGRPSVVIEAIAGVAGRGGCGCCAWAGGMCGCPGRTSP